MMNAMTTDLPPFLVAHAGGELCGHLTATPNPCLGTDLVLRHEAKTHLRPRTDFRTMSGVLEPVDAQIRIQLVYVSRSEPCPLAASWAHDRADGDIQSTFGPAPLATPRATVGGG
jgi:hypothetical protein